ncbi:hypothetical protein IKT18_02255 [Candidatus Saccharibacteria bacterium]|nr:hypothetical protein [Candidatus Saccharibacteria bacterium]
MTQEHLQEVEEIRRNKFFESPEDEELWEESFMTAMQLWEDFAEGYRTAIIEYKFLAAERRKAKICPIYTVPKGIISEYPYVQFFFCLDEVSAREYLRDISVEELPARTMNLMDLVETNHAYNSIITRVKEFRYLQKRGKHKSYCYGLSAKLSK